MFGPTLRLAGLLAPDFTTITYDRRGRNESGDSQPYAIDHEIADIDALIKPGWRLAYVMGL